MNQYNPDPVAFANNKPNTITFAVSSREQMVEAFRISKDGIRANPDIPADEAAHAVMSALNTQIKQLVQQAVEEEREACARACQTQWSTEEERAAGLLFAAEIRARSKT
jgi:hypothetical protein